MPTWLPPGKPLRPPIRRKRNRHKVRIEQHAEMMRKRNQAESRRGRKLQGPEFPSK